MTEQLMARMNERHFVTNVMGKTVVGTEKDRYGRDIPLQFSNFQSFREFYSNRTVTVATKNNDGSTTSRQVPMGTWWLNHKDRRQYDRVGYWPRASAPPGAYNLWRGFAVTPKKGDWSNLQEHIWLNICRRDDDLYKYVIQWMAFAVQKPAVPPGVALVMRGTKGSGKGTVANALGRLFGPHYMAVANSDQVTGKFNAHLHNITLFFIDEGFWAGDKRAEGVLKQMITEPYLPIERKFFDVENVPNRLHIIMASNESWIVPARSLERRFLVLDLDDKHAQDTVFFGAIHAQLEHGGYEAMLYDLLEEPLSEFDVRTAPKTSGLLEQMIHSMTPFEEWWFRKLRDGRLLPDKTDWGRVMVKRLFEDYQENVDDKHPLTESRFGLELRHWTPGDGPKRIRAVGKGQSRPWMYEFPPLSECRAEFARQHGVEVKWDEDEKETSS